MTLWRDRALMVNYTAKYTKIDSGCVGQLVEWPEVVTEGKDLEECRAMLRDVLHKMVLAYRTRQRNPRRRRLKAMAHGN